MLSLNYKNNFIANYVITSWIVNLQIIYLSSIFIFQNDWLNCYILLFFYCLFGQLPVKPKIPLWLSPVCMLLTTIFLYLNLPLIAATTVLFSHWLQGEQPIRPKMLGINIILIQNFLLTFFALCVGHLLTVKTTFNPQRTVLYRIRFFKPLWLLLLDQCFTLTLLTIAIWIYIISLPTLAPNDLIFSLLPSCVTAYIVSNRQKNIEPFLRQGYISLYLGLACLAELINLFMLPQMETWLMQPSYLHLCLLIIQQMIQVCLIGALLAVFNIQLTIYKNLAQKRHTEGFHFIYSMVNVIIIIILSIWVTHQQNIYQIAHGIFVFSIIGMIITIYRYPAPTLKASLRSAVKHAFRIEVSGMHHLEKATKPFVITPNHNSYLEPPILAGMLPGRFMFPINPEAGNMLAVRLTEAFWQKLPISPNKPMMLKPFIHGLKHGKQGIIFPEGQRSPIGKIGKIYPGAFFAAQITESYVIPIIVDGSQYHVSSRMKTTFKKVLFPKITIQIGQPIKVTKQSNINEHHIRQLMIDTQYLQNQPKHIKYAINKLIKQIGDNHKCLLTSKKRLTLKQVLKAAKHIQWQHKSFYHVTEDNYSPIHFLSALLNDIPIIFGDVNKIKSPTNAIYDVQHNQINSYTMADIMSMLYKWTYNSPIYSESNVFIAGAYNDFRITLFGFIGSILTGATCIIPESLTNIAQDIYLEHANVLMINKHYFDALLNDATPAEISFIKHTIAFNVTAANQNHWQKKFLHPVYFMDYNSDSLLLTMKTAFDSIRVD